MLGYSVLLLHVWVWRLTKHATVERANRMCDYSLEHLASRPAQVGDRLVTTIFSNSITRGLAEYGKPDVAVCLRPGTELAFDADVSVDHALGFFPTKNLGQRTARFTQISPDMPHQHHDALEFPDGRIVYLTRLVHGQTCTVLQLPVTETVPEQATVVEPVAERTAELQPAE